MSAARLKGYNIDAVLLRRGEEFSPVGSGVEREPVRETSAPGVRTLLGVAIDASGSMQESIHNKTGEKVSRFESVKSALTDVGIQLRHEVTRRSVDASDDSRVFIYAFGLRIGNGVADMASLLSAAQKLDLKREVEIRKQRYEANARSESQAYSGLASLARSYGLGGVVRSITEAATNSIREKIIGEIADLVLAEAVRLGDTLLTGEDLARLFDLGAAGLDERQLEQIFFGLTPMALAAKEVRDRFGRIAADSFKQRSLLVISDGVPTDGDPREPLAELSQSGVSITGCYVTNDDIASPRVLHGSASASWPEGARLMWDISSPLDESSSAAQYLLANGWSLEPGAKLFVQVNHSDVLREFVHIAGTYFRGRTSNVLPRGV